MMRALVGVITLVASLSLAVPAACAPDSPRVRLTEVAAVDTPTAMAFRRGDDTIYVAEQAGRVVAVRDGEVVDEPVLDLTHRVTAGGELGLLGLAFSPDGTTMYVHFSNNDADTRVEAYDVEGGTDAPAKVDLGSRRVLLRIDDQQPNHNGGQLAFGPDDRLYLGMGDGGGAGDLGAGHVQGGNAQSTDTLLGKILLVNTEKGGARICDLGLRNPWRFSFDRDTGDLWIGDVGESDVEEIDRLPGDRPCGHNLGWNVFEGDDQHRPGQIDDVVQPFAELSHDDGNCSVIGGHVYRGTEIPELEGWYVFTDYCNGRLRALRVNASSVEQVGLGARANEPSSFGEGPDGELYLLSQRDGLFRIEAR